MRIIISYLRQHFTVSVFLILAVWMCVGGIFWIYSCLMINNIKHLFINHLLLFGEVSIQTFCSFKKLGFLGGLTIET